MLAGVGWILSFIATHEPEEDYILPKLLIWPIYLLIRGLALPDTIRRNWGKSREEIMLARRIADAETALRITRAEEEALRLEHQLAQERLYVANLDRKSYLS